MIRGFWHPRFGLPAVTVSVWLDDLAPWWSAIDFTIDTGATHSLLQPHDLLERVGLSPDDLSELRYSSAGAVLGLGGAVRFSTQAASFLFDNDGSPHHLIGHAIDALEPSRTTTRLPSLLGWDILRHFTLLLNDERIELTPR